MVAEEADGVVDDQLAQTRVGDAELGVASPQIPPAADECAVLGVLLELASVRQQNAFIGVAALEVEALDGPIALAPLAVGLVVISPQPPVIPDSPRIERRTLPLVDGDLEAAHAGDDLPVAPGKNCR